MEYNPEWLYYSGHLTSDLKSRLKNSISNFIIHTDFFYIGITDNPYRRFREHKFKGFKRMVVLYRTSSAKYEKNLEKELVEYYRSKYSDKLMNNKGGGGGRFGQNKFKYLYLLLGKIGE